MIKKKKKLNIKQKRELLRIAREAVENFVMTGHAPKLDVVDAMLNEQSGAYVTLKKDGEIRGSIGQIVPSEKPLWQVVRDSAMAACCEDPRFKPITKKELPELVYEISVLTKPELIDSWRRIKPGRHGVVVQKGLQGGVYLPQTAEENGWTREEFIEHLCCEKAGLAKECYKNDPDLQLQIFEAQVF